MVGKNESNEQTAMVVPDYLKGVQGQNAGSMESGIGMSVPRISLKGRRFRFIKGDEETVHKGDEVDLIIIGVEPENGLAKTFYIKGYDPSSSDPPDCSSWDGVRPDSWVNAQQADFCAQCEQNMWGSAKSMSGKKAKACKESKRLIVVRANDLDGDYFILNVTIASLNALSTYGKFLSKNQLPFSAVITKVSFVDSDFPQIQFEMNGFLPEKQGLAAIARSEEREWEGFTQSTPQLENKQPAARQLPASPASAQSAAPAHTDADAPASQQDVQGLVDNW